MKNFLLGALFSYSLFVSVLYAQKQEKQSTMSNSKTIPTFHVVGISVRTTNENNQGVKDIEALWTRFWEEKIQSRIPGRISDDIYAVYTDYETDFTGAYTTVIGVPVQSLDSIPAGFKGITIAADTYREFISKGKMPDAIMDTWMEIWQNKDMNRAYHADFTIHGKKYYDGDDAEVNTFISIKD